MYAQNIGLTTLLRFRTITNWGIAGVIMVGLPAYLLIDEDGATGFMTFGFVSFMVIRGLLMWWEYRDTKQGF